MNSLLTRGIETRRTLTDFVTSGLREIKEIKRDGRTWVSQVSVCPRQGALAATYQGDGIDDAAKAFYCEFGNTAEDLILKGWYNSGILLFADYALPDLGLNLGGKIDAIVMYNGKITVAEVKTCGTVMPTKAKGNHKAQAALYAAITGLPYVLYYQSRNVASFGGKLKAVEFAHEFNRDDLLVHVFNAVYARLCIDEFVMPNKFIEKNGEKCSFCQFTDVCFGNEIPHLDIASPDEQMSLIKEATKRAELIMDEDNIKQRRNGVVKHISMSTNKNAQHILKGKSWSEFF